MPRDRRIYCWLLLAGCLFLPASAFAQANLFETPEKLWRDFNPESPDLEVESLKKWEEKGAGFEKLRFTSERESGGKVRVFAIRGAPLTGTKLPGILHIHGGGQTASLDWVRFWTRRGYVCVTFDYTGPWAGRKEYTEWGPIKQGNLTNAQGGLMFRPTARSSSFFHWALAARRALTLLSYHPKVDRERLGIFGVSVGGTLCWIVAATDDRVKTSVPIYGCGRNYDRHKTIWGFPELNRDLLLFNHVLAPEAYAESIRRPVLFLGATNDFHGWMDDAYQIVAETQATWRLAFTPRYNHHIDAGQATNLPAWMDWQLRDGPPFPEEPKLELKLADVDAVASVRPDDAGHVSQVDFYYTLADKPPPNRFWRHAETTHNSTAWQATLPLMKAGDKVHAFANVFYQSGVCLSTNLAQLPGSRFGGQGHGTLKWSASPNLVGEVSGGPFVFGAAYTDPIVSFPYFVRSPSPDERDAICINSAVFGDHIHFGIVSHYIGDPGYVGRDDMSLAFEYQGEFIPDKSSPPPAGAKNTQADAGGLTVEVTSHDWTPKARRYAAHIDTPASASPNGWQAVTLPVSKFHTAEGKALSSWGDLDKIELRGTTTKQNPPKFRKFHWAQK